MDSFICVNYIYYKSYYFKECLSFLFKFKKKLLTWQYRRFFSCDIKDVFYVLICNNCDFFLFPILKKPKNWNNVQEKKSDVILPNNSNCKKCSEHLRTCSKKKEKKKRISIFNRLCMKKTNTFENLKKDAI